MGEVSQLMQMQQMQQMQQMRAQPQVGQAGQIGQPMSPHPQLQQLQQLQQIQQLQLQQQMRMRMQMHSEYPGGSHSTAKDKVILGKNETIRQLRNRIDFLERNYVDNDMAPGVEASSPSRSVPAAIGQQRSQQLLAQRFRVLGQVGRSQPSTNAANIQSARVASLNLGGISLRSPGVAAAAVPALAPNTWPRKRRKKKERQAKRYRRIPDSAAPAPPTAHERALQQRAAARRERARIDESGRLRHAVCSAIHSAVPASLSPSREDGLLTAGRLPGISRHG
jgi:hypothetical protein